MTLVPVFICDSAQTTTATENRKVFSSPHFHFFGLSKIEDHKKDVTKTDNSGYMQYTLKKEKKYKKKRETKNRKFVLTTS